MLHAAVLFIKDPIDRYRLVAFLLNRGADPTVKDALKSSSAAGLSGLTPLDYFSEFEIPMDGSYGLLKKAQDIYAQYLRDPQDTMYRAIGDKYLFLIKQALLEGRSFDFKDHEGLTPFHIAVITNDHELIKIIAHCPGIRKEEKHRYGDTAQDEFVKINMRQNLGSVIDKELIKAQFRNLTENT